MSDFTPADGGLSPQARSVTMTARPRLRGVVWAALATMIAVAIGLGFVSVMLRSGGPWGNDSANGGGPPAAIPAIYDADRAFGYLERICEFGPRPSGSAAMVEQRKFLQSFFAGTGGDVRLQSYEIRHPETGQPVAITNLIASWHPEASRRYLAAAHYDTRPYPDNDRQNPRGEFIGANDGASGTAALMEWSHRFNDLPDDIGIDVVLFDGEELVYDNRRDEYFLGSTYFATEHARSPTTRYIAGVLLDMVGDKDLQLYYERNSLLHAPKVTRDIWKTARRLGVRAFVSRARHNVRDDHLPLNQIAGIPTVDLIDFDYPRPGAPSYWHTTQDLPSKCSGESLVSVIYVLDAWLRDQSAIKSDIGKSDIGKADVGKVVNRIDADGGVAGER